MKIDYFILDSIPEPYILEKIIQLNTIIFGASDDLISKMERKSRLLLIIAIKGNAVIGYKIGYALNNDKFYSWLGGVDPNYREFGIGSTLMKKQHHYLRENGYSIVQTKTMNRWRSMLVMNIKNGFNIIDTYTDEKGLHKIILEKNLLS